MTADFISGQAVSGVRSVIFIFHAAVYLRRQHDLLASSAALLEPASDNFLRPPFAGLAVYIRCIKEVNARIQRGIHNFKRFLFLGLRSKIHGTQTQPADL